MAHLAASSTFTSIFIANGYIFYVLYERRYIVYLQVTQVSALICIFILYVYQ